MTPSLTVKRLVAVALLMLLAGVQLGLWLADYFDDGVHEPLSLAIGLAMLAAGVAGVVVPLLRR